MNLRNRIKNLILNVLDQLYLCLKKINLLKLFCYSSYTFNDSITAGKATRLSESLNMSISQAGLENLTMSESKKDQLKAAFLLFCRKEFVSFFVVMCHNSATAQLKINF
jgi:hypothetical protein